MAAMRIMTRNRLHARSVKAPMNACSGQPKYTASPKSAALYLGILVLGVLGACGRVGYDPDLVEDSSPSDPIDARAPDAAIPIDAAPILDAAPVPDAAVPIDAPACSPGEFITPVSTFNASPVRPESACNLDNGLEADGVVAGLDLHGLTQDDCLKIDPRVGHVCGCVGFDLGAELPASEVYVRAGAVAKGCERECSSGCDTGHTMAVFAGPAVDNFVLAREVELAGRPLQDYVLTVDANDNVRYVIACRMAWSAGRDDVAIDSVSVKCQ